jgi:hypothetical protein
MSQQSIVARIERRMPTTETDRAGTYERLHVASPRTQAGYVQAELDGCRLVPKRAGLGECLHG